MKEAHADSVVTVRNVCDIDRLLHVPLGVLQLPTMILSLTESGASARYQVLCQHCSGVAPG